MAAKIATKVAFLKVQHRRAYEGTSKFVSTSVDFDMLPFPNPRKFVVAFGFS
jgi:hypothetical protein